MQGLTFLLSCQNPDGGWGYEPQRGSLVEPTSAVLLAMRKAPAAADSCRRAADWLCGAQHPDGGWGFSAGDPESGWQTAWALLALRSLGVSTQVSVRAIHWLLNVKTLQLTEDTIQKGKKVLTIDLSRRGWPWLPGEAGWVEPTALALLALESAPGVEAENRRKEALGFIEDRRCPQGGWNVGSPVMFASGLPGRAHSTAWVILALAKTSPGMIRPGDKEFLRAEMRRERGVLGFAWGLLALRAAGEEDREAEDRLRRLQGKNGGWENSPFKTAAAQMALGGQL